MRRGTSRWDLGGSPSHKISKWRHGFGSFGQTEAELGLEEGVGSAIIPAIPHHSLMGLRCYSTHLRYLQTLLQSFGFWHERHLVKEKSFLGVKCLLKEHPLFGYKNLNWGTTVLITWTSCWSINMSVSFWASSDVTDLLDLQKTRTTRLTP